MSAQELDTVVGGIQQIETLELEPLPTGGLFKNLDNSLVNTIKKDSFTLKKPV